MFNKVELIDNYKSNISSTIKRGNVYTKKFLKWNRKMIKEGETNIYLREGYLYNPKTNRENKIQYKKNTTQIKDSFREKFISQDTNRINIKIGWSDDTNNTNWNNERYLNNNNLLRLLINQNNITGQWRLTIVGLKNNNKQKIIDKSFLFSNNFWKENKVLFQLDSTYMKWNDIDMAGEKVFDNVLFIFSKDKTLPYKFIEQHFRDGINHCVFEPIKNWITEKIAEAKTNSTKEKYTAKLNKINGKELKTGEKKIGLEEKYINGVPQNKLCEICEELQIGFIIEQPFNENPLYEYKSNKKPLKIFKFLNTRMNHIELNKTPCKIDSVYNIDDNIKIETYEEMEKIYDELNINNNMAIIQRDINGITRIRTLTNSYIKTNDFYEKVNKFEIDTGLINCSIDGLKYPLLQKFLDDSIHFNCCIDLKDTSKWKTDNIPKNIKHIDMIKAYSQFKKCGNYTGFMGKITDFRKVDNYKQNGIYYIEKLDLSNCNSKFKKINSMLGYYETCNSYTKAELQHLEKNGGKFKVIYGAYGLDIDFEFNKDMLESKEKIILGDTIKKISYYAKYSGMISSTNTEKSFYMKGTEEFFNNIKQKDYDIYYNEKYGEGRVVYNKKYMYNKKHITAQITAYQRLNMWEQLNNMNLDKIVRICVDGIYYEEHNIKINSDFSFKESMTFVNDPATEYLSNLNHNFNYDDIDIKDIPESRDFYYRQLFIGAGGNGKTYYNLNDKGLINPIYIAHSWKLATTQQKEFNGYLPVNVYHNLLFTNGDNSILQKYNNYIIDEASMINENERNYYFKNILGKIIMCGDLGYQLPPINGIEMKTDKFENIVKLEKNYRFTCKKLLVEINKIRDNIKNKKICNLDNFKRIKKNEVKELYNKEDIILVSSGSKNNMTESNYNNYWNNELNINKYKIINNTRNYKNGQIIYEPVKDIGVNYELRNGYTIHSLQGDTHKEKLFIDMRGIKCNKMLYTAISRAKTLEQIYLVF